MDNIQARRQVYDVMQKLGGKGTFEQFNAFLDNPDGRRQVYDILAKKGGKGTFEQFNTFIGDTAPAGLPDIPEGAAVHVGNPLPPGTVIVDPATGEPTDTIKAAPTAAQPMNYVETDPLSRMDDMTLNRQIVDLRDKNREIEEYNRRTEGENRRRQYGGIGGSAGMSALLSSANRGTLERGKPVMLEKRENPYARPLADLERERLRRDRTSAGAKLDEMRRATDLAEQQHGEDIYTKTARKLQRDTEKLLSAPSRLDSDRSRAWWEGFSDQIANSDTWSGGITEIARSLRLGDLAEKLEKGGSLTDSETLALESYADYVDAKGKIEPYYSAGYRIGQGTAASVPFTVEMIATAGLGAAAKKALVSSLVKAGRKEAAEKLAKALGGVTLRNAVKDPITGGIIRDSAGKAVKEAVTLGATKTAGGKIGKEVAETVLQTAAMPATWAGVSSDRLDTLLSGEDYDFLDFARSFTDNLVETFTERTGGKLIDRAFSFIPTQKLWGGFRGIRNLFGDYVQSPLGETGEEYIGAIADYARSFNPLYSDEENEAMREEARRMFTAQGFGETFLTVLPMSLLGGGINAAQYGGNVRAYRRDKRALHTFLTDTGMPAGEADRIISAVEAAENDADFIDRLSTLKASLDGKYAETNPRATEAELKEFREKSNRAVTDYFRSAAAYNGTVRDLGDRIARMTPEEQNAIRASFSLFTRHRQRREEFLSSLSGEYGISPRQIDAILQKADDGTLTPQEQDIRRKVGTFIETERIADAAQTEIARQMNTSNGMVQNVTIGNSPDPLIVKAGRLAVVQNPDGSLSIDKDNSDDIIVVANPDGSNPQDVGIGQISSVIGSAPVQTLNEQAETSAAEEVRIRSAYPAGSLLTDSRGNWSVVSGTSADGITAEATAPDGSTLSTGIPASELGGYTALPITPGTRIGDMTVIASDENGIVLRDGQGREYSPKSPAELADMLTSAQLTPDTQSQSAPAAHSAPASPVPSSPQQPPSDGTEVQKDNEASEKAELSDYPKNSKGEPDFLNMTREQAAAVIEKLAPEQAIEFLDGQVADVAKRVLAYRRQKPNIKSYNSMLDFARERESKMQEAQEAMEHWVGIYNIYNKRHDNPISSILSNEIDEKGRPFVVASDGTTIFGEIKEETGLDAAPIKLSVGYNTKDKKGNNHGYGLSHIEASHGQQIRDAGFPSVMEFIQSVAKNYDTIRKGNKRGDNETYLLEVSDSKNNTLFVELSNDGTYWNVNSAGIFRGDYSKKKEIIWSLPEVRNTSAATDAGVQGNNDGDNPMNGDSPQMTDDTGSSREHTTVRAPEGKDTENTSAAQYPTDKKGEPLFEQMDFGTAAGLIARLGEETAERFINNNIDAAQKAVKNAQKRVERATSFNTLLAGQAAVEKARTRRHWWQGFRRHIDTQREAQAAENIRTPEEAQDLAAQSLDPLLIAAEYTREKETATPHAALLPWQRELLGTKFTTRSFDRFADPNLRTGSLARAWLSDTEGRAIDGVAQELSTIHGVEMTPQMVVDFIVDNPTGYVPKTTERMKDLNARFKQLAARDGYKTGGIESDTGRMYLRIRELQREADSLRNAAESEAQPLENTAENVTFAEENDNGNGTQVSDGGAPHQQREGDGVQQPSAQSGRAGGDSQSEQNARGLREAIEGKSRDEAHRVAEQWARDNGLWHDYATLDLGTPFRSGNENDTYLSPDGNTIYKINNLMNSRGDLAALLDRIALHNSLFPETAYEFVGLAGFGGGQVYPIFKQTYVADNTFATEAEIDAYMRSIGFTPTGREAEYSNGQYTVGDLRPRNVLKDAEGSIQVIDAEITDNRPAAGEEAAADNDNASAADNPTTSSEDTDTGDNWLDRAWEDSTPLPFRIGNPARQALASRRATAEAALKGMNIGSAEVTFIESPDTIADHEAKAAIEAGAPVSGWYSPASDTVYIYLPNVTTLNDTRKTILHELVAHKGLRSLLGEDFVTLCDNVWEAMDDTSRRRFAAYVWDTMSRSAREKVLPAHGGTVFADIPGSQLGHIFTDSGIQRAAADECMAHFAEEGVKEKMSLWQKISALVRQALRKIGAVRMTDADLAYLLYRSRRRLTEENATPLGRFSLHGERMRVRRSLSSPSASRSLGFPSPMNLRDMEAVRLRIAPAANEWDVTPEAYEEMQAIKARAISGGTFMKAPNGADTRLTERQWLQVRTAPFKTWFGDWEKAARIEKLRRSKPVEITGDEYKGKYELNRDSAKQWMKNNLRGEYVIDDTNEKVLIGRKGINKVSSHSMGNEAHLKSLSSIPEMLKNAIFITEETADKANAQYPVYRYYVVGLRIGDVDYTAKLTIGVDENGNKFYDHALTEIEKNKLLDLLGDQAAVNGFISTGAEPYPSVTIGKDTKLLSLLQTNSSKVVDGNGEPLVVFHGTNAQFNTFSSAGGTYWFSEYADYAESMAEERGGDRTVHAFLYIRNPQYIRLSPGRFSDPVAEAPALAEAKAGGNDGVVFENDTENEIERDIFYAAFSPSQIKSATDNNGEFSDGDNDIRFRITQPVEQSGNLIAVHNLSKEKLREAFELGGFPMPSIAITKADMGHTEFGDISLVFGKETIDPADSRNKVYGEDAWTPTFPSVGYKLNDDKTSDIYRRANKAGSLPMFRPVEFHPDNYERYISGSGSESLVEHFKDDYGAKQLFLSETGNAVEKYERHEVDKYLPDQLSLYEKELEKIGLERLKGERNDALEDEVRQLISEHYGIDFDAMKPHLAKVRVSNTINRAVDYAENGNKKTETDIEATKRKIDERTDPKKFAEWLEDMFSGIVEKRGIRNDRDPFTPSGNSRKWEALYDDITLDNVVRAMQRQSTKGGQGLFGGSIFGAAQKEFKSMDEIRKDARERIRTINDADYKAQRDAITDRLSAIQIPGAGNSFSDTMDMVNNIQDAVSRSNNAKGIHKYLKEFYPKVTMETADEIADIVKDIQRLNARYFEAKPYRAVGFGEVRLAVVPEGTDADIIGGLDSYRIPVRTYSRGDMTQRVNVLNDAANELGIRFRYTKRDGINMSDNASDALDDGKTDIGIDRDFGMFIGDSGLGTFTGEYHHVGQKFNRHYFVRLNDGVTLARARKEYRRHVDDKRQKEIDGVLAKYPDAIPEKEAMRKLGTENVRDIWGQYTGVAYTPTSGIFWYAPKDSGVRYRITPQEDAEYLEAVNNGDIEKAQRMVNMAAERAGYNSDSSYQGSMAFNGAAPSSNAYFETKEERKEAWDNEEFEGDFSLGDYIDNGIDTNDLDWKINDPRAMRGKPAYTKESIKNLRTVIESGTRKIKMYRAVDSNIKEDSFRNGDWITPSRSYAEHHISLNGHWNGGRIIEQEVSVDDIWWDGNDINEWGYDDGNGYVYKNTPNNRKLAAITYDDSGNVIPLSERFNETVSDVRFRITPEIREANERFNEELEKYKSGKMRSSDMFNLGVPSDILKAAGINGNEIVLTQNVLREHLDKHGLDAADIKDLPLALQEPIMVYEWGDKAKSSVVITDIPKGNDRITTAIRTSTNGKEIEVSRIASVHPKSVERLLKEMDTEKSNFAKDNLRYVDKRKALDWIAMVSPEETSQSGQGLDSAAKIIQNFENPKLPEDLQREADNLRYRIANDPAAVYPEPQRREGESLMDYFRRYAEWREKKIAYKHLTGEEIPPYPRYTPGESLIEWFETYQAYRLGVEDAQAVSEHMRNIQKSGGRLRQWQVKWTDCFINLKKFREEMQKAGAKIPPEADFYNAVFLTPFKITRATEKFRAREWKNLLSALARFTSSQGIGNIELKWQNLANEELKTKGEKRNGTPLTSREIADVYVQAKDIEEARQLGLLDRGAAGFVKNLGVTHTDVIRMVEDNIPSDTVAQLWESIRAATDFALDYEVSHGVISRETRDKYSARKHYVPERGWVERDMDGRKTNYISKGGDYGSQYNPALIRSKGRTSIASSPFPYIQSIAESAIRESELNAEKLAFKRFADTNEAIGVKTGAFEFREAWLLNVKDTDGTTKLGQDGKPLTEVTYARPTAEMFAHDRETDKKIREIRKDIAARQKQSEKTEAKIAKEKSPSADLYDRLDSLQKEIDGLEEQITALENSRYIAGNVRSGDIPHRSESEKRQHHVHVRDGGRDYVIFLENESVANAVNRQFDSYRSAFIDGMADTLGRGTRMMASWNTQYNPGFAVANFLRDFQFAILINDATHGSKYAARFVRNTFSAFGALHAYASGNEDSYTGKYSRYLKEFLDSGALTGYSFTKPVRDIAKDFDRELKKAGKDLRFDELDDGSLGHAIMKFMHNAANRETIARAAGYLSVISEMAVRFGEYVTARESGLGVQQSASRAKEVSTNFDRHGLYGRQMNRLFAYFNATLQGTVRVAYAYLQSPRAARRLAAFSLAYAAAGFINTMLNPDDPDDEVYLSDYTRMTNLTAGNWRVPLPHYFRMFFAIGVQTALAFQGRKPWEEALTDTVQFIAGDLLPGALNLTEGFYFDSTTGSMGYDMKRQLRSMMPTVASPIADVGLNMNFMGLPVAKEPFLSTDKGKLSQVNMYNSRTAEPYRYIADAILEMTGGNPDLRYKAGGLDINPSYIEHIVEGYTPGLVKDIAGMTSMLLSVDSKGFNWGHLPVAGRFYNKIDPESVYRSQYWQLKNNIDFYSLQLKDSRKNDRRRYREMTESPRHEVYLKTRGILRRMDKPVVGEDVSFDAADIRRLMDANIAWTLEDTSAIE